MLFSGYTKKNWNGIYYTFRVDESVVAFFVKFKWALTAKQICVLNEIKGNIFNEKYASQYLAT